MDSIDDFMKVRQPTALRPLMGLTVLLVEDSRFASEAMRMLCIRSGARIRRADSLHNAKRHLSVYRPSVMIVDVGLPDGSGLDLIEAVSHGNPPIDVVLGTSGDLDMAQAVMDHGANGFLAKPIGSIAEFQSQILAHLPHDQQPPGPRLVTDEVISPDMIAYHDDLSHVAEVLKSSDDGRTVAYVAQFLKGVARSAKDDDLDRAAAQLASLQDSGDAVGPGLQKLNALVQSRLAQSGPI